FGWFSWPSVVINNVSDAVRPAIRPLKAFEGQPRRKWTKKRVHQTRRVVGDLSIGQHPWVLKDMNLWNAIGDIRVNLATAHVEDGTYQLDVSGYIGDIRVLVPEGLSVDVTCSLKVGDVNVFGDRHSGMGHREVSFRDPDFDTAVKRVIIRVELIVGDVLVQRV
ncbi:MAG: cell wall-active antibiotics response protein, partial [Alicyclobacillus sp.]|nr:cell wall-active antibiotics response protein [Alicyclobacillus sp.]